MKSQKGLGLLVLAFFSLAGCDSKNAQVAITKIVTVTNSVPDYITNSVVFTNEVIKEVPQAIPSDYENAYQVAQNMRLAAKTNTFDNSTALFKLDNVRVLCTIADGFNSTVSGDEIKAKVELTLRRNGVPINQSANSAIVVNFDAFYQPGTSENVVVYLMTFELIEKQWVFRNGEVHMMLVPVWKMPPFYGIAGKNKVEDSLLNQLEKNAEVFSNDYLSDNPK